MDSAIKGMMNAQASLQEQFLNEEIERFLPIDQKFKSMVDSFRGLEHPSYNKDEWSGLLEASLAFEKDVVFLEQLNFLYPKIARMFLNIEKIPQALKYANAGLELCRRNKDLSGVSTSFLVICDAAVCNSNFKAALEILDIAQKETGETYSNYPLVQSLTEIDESDKTASDYFVETRPSSFRYVRTEEAQQEEAAIRFFLKLDPSFSRKEAKNAFAAARSYSS